MPPFVIFHICPSHHFSQTHFAKQHPPSPYRANLCSNNKRCMSPSMLSPDGSSLPKRIELGKWTKARQPSRLTRDSRGP